MSRVCLGSSVIQLAKVPAVKPNDLSVTTSMYIEENIISARCSLVSTSVALHVHAYTHTQNIKIFLKNLMV